MNIIYVISIVQIILWLFIFIYTYEYFTRTEVNRFRFKYWVIISILNIFQIIAIIGYDVTHSRLLLMLIKGAFVLITINLMEIFIHTTKKKIKRKIEILFRVFFLTIMLCYIATSNIFFLCMTLFIVATLSTIYERIYFLISFSIYMAYIIISNSTGYLELNSVVISLIYTAHLTNGIRKMYCEEQVRERICNE